MIADFKLPIADLVLVLDFALSRNHKSQDAKTKWPQPKPEIGNWQSEIGNNLINRRQDQC